MQMRLQSSTWFMVALISSFLQCTGMAETVDTDNRIEKIDRHLKTLSQDNGFSGVVFIEQDENVILSKGYNLANREFDIPNTAEVKFRLGSVTKQFTAMAIMILQEKAMLDVHDKICQYINECPDHWKEITIHQLLTHTSGIKSFTSFPDNLQHERLPAKVEETVARFKDLPLNFSPGEKFQYSNSGYVLLGNIIETVSGKSYEAFVKENIFKPLGMQDSGYDNPEVVLSNRASGYSKSNGKIVNCVHFEMDTPHAAGALYSTVHDLQKWKRALQMDTLIPKEARQKMFNPNLSSYAYGLIVGERNKRMYVLHTGGISGFVSFAAYYPDDDVFVALLSNFDFISIEEIAESVQKTLFSDLE